MPKVSDLKSSKFLTKHDVEPEVVVTIDSYEELDVSMESQAPEMKWCLYFKQFEKPLVLNSTNGQLIEAILGSDDFDDWIGQQVVLYNDPTVSFGGKLTGGIRVKAKRQTMKEAIRDVEAYKKTRTDLPQDEPSRTDEDGNRY